LPIWENTKKQEDIIVAGTLEEIYQGTRTGSQNLTKNVIIRHGETVYNETHTHDSYSNTELNKNGIKQAKKISKYLSSLKKDDRVIIITPLTRSLQTVFPFLEKKFPESISGIQKKYQEIQKTYQNLWNQRQIQSYLKNPNTQKLFQIHEKIYVDFRTTDLILPELQNKIFPTGLSVSKSISEKLTSE
jgi:bisphosphoglycerate-dependent phosphoglycerate mutase